MPYVNKIEIMGNLGKDPELKHMANGHAVCNISLAVTERWTDRETGEIQEHTEWFPVVLYRNDAETVCRHMKKGDCLQVWGKLHTRKYTDRDGIERSRTEIIALEKQIIHTRARAAASEPGAAAAGGGIHDLMM